MTSRRYAYDDTYTERHFGGRSGAVQDVSAEDIAYIRSRELAAFRGSQLDDQIRNRRSRPDYDGNDISSEYKSQRQVARREDMSISRKQGDLRRSQKQDRSFSLPRDRQMSNDLSRRTTRSRAGGRNVPGDVETQANQLQTQSSNRQVQQSSQQQEQQQQEQYNNRDGRFGKQNRPEDNWFDRNLDKTHNGAIAAAAGAAIGAITVRHFSATRAPNKQGEIYTDRSKWQMAGGAVLGAAAFNMAENRFRDYFEEQEERKEDVAMAAEMGGELIGAVGPAP